MGVERALSCGAGGKRRVRGARGARWAGAATCMAGGIGPPHRPPSAPISPFIM